jgi:hypothetical protein
MSGTIAISPDVRWSAAGWLFDWIVEFLADNVADPDVAADLREIVTENLGWLGLDDYGPETRAELRDIMSHQLLAAADESLPQTVPNRPAVIELLEELAGKAR